MGIFATQTRLPMLERQAFVEQSRIGLMEQAKALTPDAQALSEKILSRDLMPGDKARYSRTMNILANTYMDNFSKDPFWAFSREGRNVTKQMRALSQDPNLEILEAKKKDLDEKYKRAHEDGVAYMPVISGNMVKVFNNDTGTARWTNIQNLKEGDNILDVNEMYRIASDYGVSRIDDLDYNMTDPRSLQDKILALSSKVGSQEFEELVEVNGVKGVRQVKTNSHNLKKLGDSLLNAGLLSEQDYNTLRSMYLTEGGDEVPTMEGAREFIGSYIADIINPQIESSMGKLEESAVYGPGITGEGTGKKDNLGQIGASIAGLFGESKRLGMLSDGTVGIVDAPLLPEAILDKGAMKTAISIGGTENEVPLRTADNIPIIRDATTDWYVLGDKDNYVPLDRSYAPRLVVSAVDKNEAPATVMLPTDTQGKPIPDNVWKDLLDKRMKGQNLTLEEERAYLGEDRKVEFEEFIDGYVYVATDDNSDVVSFFEDQGYKKHDDKESVEYYERYGPRKDINTVLRFDWVPYLGDGVYKAKVRMKVSSPAAMKLMNDENVWATVGDNSAYNPRNQPYSHGIEFPKRGLQNQTKNTKGTLFTEAKAKNKQ